MESPKLIFEEEPEIDSELIKMDLTRPDLIKVVQECVLAHNNATAHHPANAPGWLAYCFGTGALRDIFCTKEKGHWEVNRKDSVESILNENKRIKIVYQNVDSAAESYKDPKARSKKGAGSERAVATNQMNLFPQNETSTLRINGTNIWYLCVSIKPSRVHAELSLPESLVDGQFSKFLKRIFILKGDDFSDFSISNIDLDSGPDVDFQVARK